MPTKRTDEDMVLTLEKIGTEIFVGSLNAIVYLAEHYSKLCGWAVVVREDRGSERARRHIPTIARPTTELPLCISPAIRDTLCACT